MSARTNVVRIVVSVEVVVADVEVIATSVANLDILLVTVLLLVEAEVDMLEVFYIRIFEIFFLIR